MYLRNWQSFQHGQIRLGKAGAAAVCDDASAPAQNDAHMASTRASRPVSPALSQLLPMTPCILRTFRYYRSQSKSSVGRRGEVWFVQPCVAVIGLKWKIKWQFHFPKTCQRSGTKIRQKNFGNFLLFWQVYISKICQLARNLPKNVVRNDPKRADPGEKRRDRHSRRGRSMYRWGWGRRLVRITVMGDSCCLHAGVQTGARCG